jgi:hypothetical protein
MLALALIENGLSFAVFGAVALSILMSIAFLLTRGGGSSAYDRIGEGGISREGDYGAGAPSPAPDSPAGRAEREQEIRQMLNARSERLVRKGQPALDVDAELARLLAASPDGLGNEQSTRTRDAGLVEEVRQLVIARNERRIRQGQEPLDVERELTRTLEELDP